VPIWPSKACNVDEFRFLLSEWPHLVQESAGGPRLFGDGGRDESLVWMRSAFTATSKELGARELFRLESGIIGWRRSSCELL
jgi:hypothetical protein